MVTSMHNKLSKIKNKKAAIELSVGTIVIIVIAMTMLIMGIVLVRNIFGGATASVTSLNDKVKSEIASLFTEEGEKIVIYGAGADRTIKIKRGTESFGFVISALADRTSNPTTGASTTRNELKYNLELSDDTDCDRVQFRSYFRNPRWATGSDMLAANNREFDDFDNPRGDVLINLNIPGDAETCTQKITVTIYDSSGGRSPPVESSKSFNIQIVSGGFFG